jgi:hypothetical protein
MSLAERCAAFDYLDGAEPIAEDSGSCAYIHNKLKITYDSGPIFLQPTGLIIADAQLRLTFFCSADHVPSGALSSRKASDPPQQ